MKYFCEKLHLRCSTVFWIRSEFSCKRSLGWQGIDILNTHKKSTKNQSVTEWYGHGPSKGTSSVVFEVLIINYQIHLINLFIFNWLTLNIKLFIFNLFDVKFLFSEDHIFCKQNRTERLLMDAHPYFRILNSPGKMMTCYLRDINKFLRYHILCKSILKCGVQTKGIKLTCFVLFETLGVPQLRGTSV